MLNYSNPKIGSQAENRLETNSLSHVIVLVTSLTFLSLVVISILCAWIWMAGPNIDTILTYHRNSVAHSFKDMFQILAMQDQAPLPQLFHYVLHRLGCTSVVSLQLVSSLLIIVVLYSLLLVDLRTESKYLKLSYTQQILIFTLAAISLIVSSSFSAAITWVRYSSIMGLAWYAVWILQERLFYGSQKKHAIFLGILLGIGFLISYTWGVVFAATMISLLVQSKFRRQKTFIAKNIYLSMIPGFLVTGIWLYYAGIQHLNLILIRTHGASPSLVKTIGKGLHLILYPFTGLILFPSVLNFLFILSIFIVLFFPLMSFFKEHREITPSFLIHMFLPVPLFVATNVTTGYGMIGPGLILMSCTIKGMMNLPHRKAFFLTAIGLPILTAGMFLNLQGDNTMSSGMFASKTRQAVNDVKNYLIQEKALNEKTLVVADEESTRYLIEFLPFVHHRTLYDYSHSSAPNLIAMYNYGYSQDNINSSINRVIVISSGDIPTSFKFSNSWLEKEGFKLTSYHKEFGIYSHWYKKFINVKGDSQYAVNEWIR